MAKSFYFYDLETTGFNPREARIMQFAGQRTDMKLQPIGEPDNILIKLTDDILPEPDAVMITKITPQKTITEGVTEAEFLKYFSNNISTAGTIFTGFNSIRFDDEFMRFLHYRNYYDAYEWQWVDDRSRWDLLDVVRMTRALRPDGIEWPFDSKGNPSNKLELIASINKLTHIKAHDALSDVQALIGVARLIAEKQPKLFSFLLSIRHKREASKLILEDKPFVYTSGKYNSQYEKTTVVGLLIEHPSEQGGALVFDLRYDPSAFIDLSPEDLADAMKRRSDEEGPRFPLKTLKYNRCPAIAPLSVLDKASQERLQVDMKQVLINYETLKKLQDQLEVKVKLALEKLNEVQQSRLLEDDMEVDGRLYEGFFAESDKTKMSLIRAAEKEELANIDVVFNDGRLEALLPLYKARNYPESLTDDEQRVWEQYKERRLLGGGTSSRAARYFSRLAELSTSTTDSEIKYILEELQLYGESILPGDF